MCRTGLRAGCSCVQIEVALYRPASRQTAPFCPFTSNLCDTHAPYTVRSFKKLTVVIEETDSGFHVGQKFVVPACHLMERSFKMRNTFPRRLRGGCTKEEAQGLKQCSLYFTCSEIFASFILHRSQEKGSGIANYRP